MKLRRTVASSKGTCKHYIGNSLVGCPVAVEIEQDGNLYYLFHLDSSGKCMADTCHSTLDEAKAQAHFEFNFDTEGWEEVQ